MGTIQYKMKYITRKYKIIIDNKSNKTNSKVDYNKKYN